MSKSKTLNDLLLHQLRDLHYAERHGAKTLGKMAKAATAGDVQAELEELAEKAHLSVDRLDAVFDKLDKKSQTVPCEAMQGIIEEAKELMHDFEAGEVLDAGLLAAASAILHYGISRLAATCSWSDRLALTEVTPLLDTMLAGKKDQLAGLGRLAAGGSAAAPGGGLTLKAAALAGLG